MYGVYASNTGNTNITSRIETVAKSTGILAYASNVVVENSLVRGGSTGIYFDYGGTKTVRNCTVAAFSSTGIFCYYGSALRLSNSIVVADGAGDYAINIGSASASMVSDNNCSVWLTQEGSAQPGWPRSLAMEAGSRDRTGSSISTYLLLDVAVMTQPGSTSPCVNAGSTSALPAGILSIWKDSSEFFGASVDIGADEVCAPPSR